MRAGPRSFLLGVVATLVVGAIVAALVVVSGVVPVAAAPQGVADRILAYASTRSIAHHAPRVANPLANDASAIQRGLRHYASMCVACHGGPGAQPQEFAAGLHPPAPDLASPEIQSFTDGMLFETIARGVGSTGMPAFGKTHSPSDVWSIVAFVRHLPRLTPDEKKALAAGASEGGHEEADAHAERHDEGHAEAAPPTSGAEHVHHVRISNFKFDPPTLTVHAGDVVEWKNEDFATHTATANDRAFDTGDIDGGETKRVVASRKGKFPYLCRYHPSMTGTVTVE